MAKRSEELSVPCHNSTHLGLSLAPAQQESQLTSVRASLISCHPTKTVQEPRRPWLETLPVAAAVSQPSPRSLQYPSFGTSSLPGFTVLKPLKKEAAGQMLVG